MPTSPPRRTARPRDTRAEAQAARERLAREIREGVSEVDVKAAAEVKRLGLIASGGSGGIARLT